MKKLFIILFSIVLSSHALSYEFNDTKEYTTKHKTILHLPKTVKLFSFFCPYCFELEKKHNTQQLLKKNINKDIKIRSYHVNFLGGPLSYILTKAWIIAEQMGIEDKMILPIFEGVQKTHSIYNTNSIRKLFLEKTNITKEQFNEFWNSLTLELLVQKYDEDIERSQLDHVPVMLINGKYIIEYSILEDLFKENFTKKYIELIHFLLNKK